MILVGLVLVAGALAALSVAVGLVALPDRAVRARLASDAGGSLVAQKPPRRLLQVERPDDASRFVLTPRMVTGLERRLSLAGHPAGWTFRNIVLMKVLVPVAVFALTFQTMILGGSLVAKVLGVLAVVVGYFVPDLLLHSRGQERQQQIQRELPDMLDKMIISIEAGLAFEASLAATAASAEGPLADEFVRTVQDIRLGMSRRVAYESLQARTSSEDLHAFIRGIIQAEEHGSSISSMVRIQSKEMRMKRKLRAEAKAGQVAVKLLGPLMLCIFPVLFIVVLAPGIMNAIETF